MYEQVRQVEFVAVLQQLMTLLLVPIGRLVLQTIQVGSGNAITYFEDAQFPIIIH